MIHCVDPCIFGDTSVSFWKEEGIYPICKYLGPTHTQTSCHVDFIVSIATFCAPTHEDSSMQTVACHVILNSLTQSLSFSDAVRFGQRIWISPLCSSARVMPQLYCYLVKGRPQNMHIHSQKNTPIQWECCDGESKYRLSLMHVSNSYIKVSLCLFLSGGSQSLVFSLCYILVFWKFLLLLFYTLLQAITFQLGESTYMLALSLSSKICCS